VNVIARSEARQQGLRHYFTGKPCSKGHIANRFVTNAMCQACLNAINRAKYAKDPEAARERSRNLGRKSLPQPTRPCPESCELCGRLPGKTSLHLDHDHKTGRFRGWLCSSCNTSLGKFGDDLAGVQQAALYLRKNVNDLLLPTDAAERKKIPIATGVLDYFPQALIEIAKVSYAGNQQHNPGEKLHWSRGKSQDHEDTLQRHFSERGKIDTDGLRHSAKMVWRALAILQMELEAEGAPMARGASEK